MPISTVWILEESNLTISGGAVLDGVTQGDGTHLVGRTITLNAPNWLATSVSDDDAFFADNDGGQTLSGAQTIGGVTYVNGTVVEAEYTLTLTDPATGLTYQVIGYNVVNSSPGYGTIEGLAFVGPESGWPPVGTPLTVTAATEGPGAAVRPYTSFVTPACFTSGTRIATPLGARLVEDLRAGDLVQTVQNGPQRLLYVARTHVSRARLSRDPALCPVQIAAHALGPGQPDRTMTVSPQHRFLVRSASCELLFGEPQVLVAAKDLRVALPMPPRDLPDGVTYLHLAFAEHQVVIADGLECESFLIGPEVFDAAPIEVQTELRSLFPNLADEDGPDWQSSLCRSLQSWEARLLPN